MIEQATEEGIEALVRYHETQAEWFDRHGAHSSAKICRSMAKAWLEKLIELRNRKREAA